MVFVCGGPKGAEHAPCGVVDVNSVNDKCPKCGTTGNIQDMPS